MADKRDWEFSILGAIVLALLLGLLCKFCIICPCSDCGEGMSYDEQSRLCCNPEKQLCCPSGSRPCDQLQGCSELQLGCQSGCCTDKCECLMPPAGNNITWTACRPGYSDCNSDGTWDCNTSNSSAVCFGGACDTASLESPPPLGMCLEGWSDCDNNETTGIALEGGAGCECNTGSGFTCCGGKCISTPVCQNPMKCFPEPCCPGSGCIIPSDSIISQCKPCSDFSGIGCSECPAGCSFDEYTGGCGSCMNPTTCNETNKCCCGYECNTSTKKCEAQEITGGCIPPLPGQCPAQPCCNGYGCLDGTCMPCSDFSGSSCGSCPIGCGFSSDRCTSCSNPETCFSDGDCCCGQICDNETGKCSAKPSCLSAFKKCNNEEECCSNICKEVAVSGGNDKLCCYQCNDGISECCDENGNSYNNTYDAACPVSCSNGGCKVNCTDGNCPVGSECCRNSNECGICNSSNSKCGGTGPRTCDPAYGDVNCSGSTCSGGACNGGGGGGNGGEPEICTSNNQCFICNISNHKCGGTGINCAADGDCLGSTCSGGICNGGGGEPGSCTSNSQCSVCNTSNNKCGGTGPYCSIDNDCLLVACSGGNCAACAPDSSYCGVNGDCCSGVCTGNKCCGGQWSCCTQEGMDCLKNEECCAGMSCSSSKCT